MLDWTRQNWTKRNRKLKNDQEKNRAHRLQTPNEGINQRNLKIWEWKLIFGRAMKAISSPGVRSP